MEIRRRRKAAGLSVDELASSIGVTARTLAQVELGYQGLGRAARQAAEKVLSVGRDRKDGTASVAHAGEAIPPRMVAEFVADPKFRGQAEAVAEALECSATEAVEIVIRHRWIKAQEAAGRHQV